jgi:hypothetical protein
MIAEVGIEICKFCRPWTCPVYNNSVTENDIKPSPSYTWILKNFLDMNVLIIIIIITEFIVPKSTGSDQ